jgi:hypothetical protein
VNCLIDYIGLKGCSEGAPGSGLYVNSLPGIPSGLLSNIANADQKTRRGAWADIQNASIIQLHTDIYSEFQKRYQLRTSVRSVIVNQDIDTTSITNASDQKRGFGIDVDSGIDSDYTRSHLMGISVESMSIYIHTLPEEAFAVSIYDGITKQSLWSKTINTEEFSLTTGAWNIIPVNQIFSTKKPLFCYEATEVDSASNELATGLTSQVCSCMESWYGFDYSQGNCPGRVFGFHSSSANNVNTITESTNSYALSATFSLVCSYENLICAMKRQFAEVLWYMSGWQTLQFALHSPQFTRENTINREQTMELQGSIYDAYKQKLSQVVSGIKLNENDICLECAGQLRREFRRA